LDDSVKSLVKVGYVWDEIRSDWEMLGRAKTLSRGKCAVAVNPPNRRTKPVHHPKWLEFNSYSNGRAEPWQGKFLKCLSQLKDD
jgi:hypothetical protein